MALKVRAPRSRPRAAAAASAVNRPVGALLRGLGAGLSAPGSSAYQSPALSGSRSLERGVPGGRQPRPGCPLTPRALYPRGGDGRRARRRVHRRRRGGGRRGPGRRGGRTRRNERGGGERRRRESLATPPGGSGRYGREGLGRSGRETRGRSAPALPTRGTRSPATRIPAGTRVPRTCSRESGRRVEGDAPPTPASFGRTRRDGFRYDDEYDATKTSTSTTRTKPTRPVRLGDRSSEDASPRRDARGPAGGRTQAPPTLRVSVCSGSAWGSARAHAGRGGRVYDRRPSGDARRAAGRRGERAARRAPLDVVRRFFDEEDAGAPRRAAPGGVAAGGRRGDGTFLTATHRRGVRARGRREGAPDGDEIRLGERARAPGSAPRSPTATVPRRSPRGVFDDRRRGGSCVSLVAFPARVGHVRRA